MRMFILMFVAMFIIITSMTSPVSHAQTMYDMKDEAASQYKQADAELNRIYKMARESCDSEGKERLKKAQLAWIKYRDLCCEAEASIYEGGSMSGLVHINCMVDLTKERTVRLKVYDVENSWK